jgi:hypothetical protein
MDIGTIIDIGKTFLDDKDSGGGGSTGLTPIEIYNEVTSQRRLPFKGTPLDPATPTTAPEQVGYDQTRRFWASLLTDYLRG